MLIDQPMRRVRVPLVQKAVVTGAKSLREPIGHKALAITRNNASGACEVLQVDEELKELVGAG